MSTVAVSALPFPEKHMHAREDDLVFSLISIVKRRRLLLAIVVVFFPALTTWLAYSMRPVYRAEAVLSPQMGDDGLDVSSMVPTRLSGLANVAGLNLRGRGGGGGTQEFIATINSREFAEAFIRDRQLMPILFASRWDTAKRTWITEEDEEPPTLADAVAKLRRLRAVEEELKTGLIRVSIDWTDPNVAADWANDLISRANEQLRTRTIAESDHAIEVLTTQLASTELQEVRQALYASLEAQINRGVLAKVRRQYAMRVIDHAAPPRVDDFVKPRRLLIIGAGIFAGLAAAAGLVGWIFISNVLRARWRAV